MSKKIITIIILIVIVVAAGIYYFSSSLSSNNAQNSNIDNSPIAMSSYTIDQVSGHNSSSDCWSVIADKVYNLTDWVNKHPGGPDKIISICGVDGSSAFDQQHEGQKKPTSELEKYLVGDLIAGSIDKGQALQGKWESLDDSKYIVEFNNDKRIEYYDGEKLSEGIYRIYDGLPVNADSVANDTGKYLIVDEGDQKFEYSIDQVDDSMLLLTYLTRGNLLKFKKI